MLFFSSINMHHQITMNHHLLTKKIVLFTREQQNFIINNCQSVIIAG
jgi:hypothetical protein